MELRTQNVKHLYSNCVICRIGTDLGVNQHFDISEPSVRSLLSQIETDKKGNTIFKLAAIRKDGETWTPYLQVVEMLILMGKKHGMVSFEEPLREDTLININIKK